MPTDETKDNQFTEEWFAQEKEMIATFFEKKVPQALRSRKPPEDSSRCTVEACHVFAEEVLTSQDIRPVDSQGATSYTLICLSQNKIVQFRLSRLDEHVLELAHTIYDHLVPMPVLVYGFPLPVYVTPVIPGVVHILQAFPKDNFPLGRQLNTVRDLATFVAKAAFWPQPRHMLRRDSWTAMAETKLRDLAAMKNLVQIEPRFAEEATRLLSELHLLNKLPLVLTHPDFAEVNLMVDPSTGHLTGVLDFEDARIEAFGMCIFGVYEGFFGEMRDEKWKFFDQPVLPEHLHEPELGNTPRSVRQFLQTAFWDTLWAAVPSWMTRDELEGPISVALKLGIINRYFSKSGDIDTEDRDDLRSVNWATGLLLEA